jgi:hypothetical protein
MLKVVDVSPKIGAEPLLTTPTCAVQGFDPYPVRAHLYMEHIQRMDTKTDRKSHKNSAACQIMGLCNSSCT